MAQKRSNSNRITVDRSAKTGRFVTDAQVRKSPSTTETEHYRKKR